MGSSFANLKWRLLLAAAMVAAVSPAGAQRTAGGGRRLLLTAPESDTVSSNVPALTPRAPDMPDFSDTIHAPGFNFNTPYDAEPLPAPVAPPISSAAAAQLQALRDKSKNWMLQTPAEIMGVPTPEKIVGITERDPAGMPKKQSAEERYLERQSRQQNSRTNASAADAFQPAPNFFGNQDPPWNPNPLNSPNSDLGTPAAMNPFMDRAEANNAAFNQNAAAQWLQSPAPRVTTPTPDQQAAMDQFKKLLEPRSPPPSASRTGNNFTAPRTGPDPLLGKSPLIGVPSAPSVGAIGMPVRVAPLPGILGQTNAPVAAPSWKPELPPWMSSVPQPGVIPQRKF